MTACWQVLAWDQCPTTGAASLRWLFNAFLAWGFYILGRRVEQISATIGSVCVSVVANGAIGRHYWSTVAFSLNAATTILPADVVPVISLQEPCPVNLNIYPLTIDALINDEVAELLVISKNLPFVK